MSCQGCRVLRRGCKRDCELRDCIQWIPSHQSQANATMFLVKFYGRAALCNLIELVHPAMRPELCRSLLFEACGRIMNPVYGSVGMIHSANWALCQEAVERVLEGQPIMKPLVSDNGGFCTQPVMPLEGSDIRHISRDRNVKNPRANKKSKRSNIVQGQRPIVEVAEGRKFEVGSSSGNHDDLLELSLAHAFPPSE